MNIFYTYIYYDPSRNNEPIYVGKGKNERAWDHLRSNRKGPFIARIKYMKKNNIKPNIGLYSDLDEELAFLVEEEAIALYGRKDLGRGPLLNLTDGGDGVTNYAVPPYTDEQRAQRSLAGKKSAMNRTYSDATRKKMSESAKRRANTPEGLSRLISIGELGREIRYKGK